MGAEGRQGEMEGRCYHPAVVTGTQRTTEYTKK